MIGISDLSKVFNPGRQNEIVSLKNISLSIEKGEFVVLIGANGSGKSTLLNTIAGSILPTSGSITIEGSAVTKLPEYKRSKWIARVFQNPLMGTASDLSIVENFRMAALRTRSKNLQIGINDPFRLKVKEQVSGLGMGLENKLDLPIGALSGGQRQALTLLMAVMDDLKILLLDEPTAALDPRSAELVMKTADRIIRDFNLTAILVTHNIKDALTYGSRVIQMNEGSILRDINRLDKEALQIADVYNWFA